MKVLQVIFESFVVGFGLLIIFVPASYMRDDEHKNDDNYWLYFKIFAAGAIFHIIGEYTGLNGWYCFRRLSKD